MNRTIIIGDIHGCFDELRELLDQVRLRPEDTLVSVGDLVDRGPHSVAVVTYFRSRENSVVLMGNHERKHARGILSYAQEITRLQFGDGYAEATAWMRQLPYFFETEDVRVVHAAMAPDVPLALQRQEILCGSTSGERELERILSNRPGASSTSAESFWHDVYTDRKPVVFGHHVVGNEPFIRDARVFGIDTGACHGGRLTAVIVPGFEVHSVPARADHWSRVRRDWQLPVLRSKSWDMMTWDDIEDKLASFSHIEDVEVRHYLNGVGEWAEALRKAPEAFLPAVNAEVRRIQSIAGDDGFAAAARQHAATSLLFQHRAGRLDLDAIHRRCATPARVFELASMLGVVLDQAARP
jgi:serine/threonine protein phosphatase 1